MRRLARFGTAVLAGLALLIGFLYLAGEIGGPIVYRLPGSYRGWIGFRYEDPTCTPLHRQGWYLIIPVDANGRGCTSSRVPAGWRYVRYEYTYPGGRRRELVGDQEVWRMGVTGPRKPMVETLFVGSKQELDRAWSQRLDIVREMERATNK